MKYVFAVLMAVVVVWSFLVPDAPAFQRPELARIFFWHFPCPMLLTVFMAIGCFFSLRCFLRIGPQIREETDPAVRRLWDVRATAALELGFLYAVLTMVTGMLFSYTQWGALWQWDPRQTSFLIALLIYGAYFAIRAAYVDEERRASYSAAYMLAAFLPLVFLIFVFPRLPQIAATSQHPTDTIMQGQLKGQYAYVTITVLALTTMLSIWVYRIRVWAGLLEIKVSHDQLEASRSNSPTSPMVRPVRIPPEG